MKDVICESCNYVGPLDSYRPNLSGMSDIRCPKCNSTNNEHNNQYLDNIYKAMNCKHGNLSPAGATPDGQALLKCNVCGSIGLDWSMKGEKKP